MLLICLAALVGGTATMLLGAPSMGMLPAILAAPVGGSLLAFLAMAWIALGPRRPTGSARSPRRRVRGPEADADGASRFATA